MATNVFANTVTVQGTIKTPGTYKAEENMSIITALFKLGGGSAKRAFKFAIVGGATGEVIEEYRFDTVVNTLDVEEPTIMGFDIGSCVVNTIRILTTYNYQKHGNVACLKELSEALTEMCDVDGEVSFEQFKALVEKAKEAAGEENKALIRPIVSALAVFPDEFMEHCDMKYCAGSCCETMYRTPCANACPADVDLPGTFALLQMGKPIESVALGRNDNPFLLTCGRICEDLPCQKFCLRQIIDKPVYTRSLHKYAGVKAAELAGSLDAALDYPALRPTTKTGKRVAVVGAGPAGLTCAYFLGRYGHEVVVYEAMSVGGGMMRVGIPDYRLPVELLNAEIDHICKMGVEIKYNMAMGKDFTLQQLRDEYDAVFVAIGAFKANRLNLPGDGSADIVTAVDFLYAGNLKREWPGLGKSVFVIGGGNVAVDCARVAWRLGADDIVMSCREEYHRMPATVDEIHHTEEEGIKIYPSYTPLDVNKDGDKYIVRIQKLPTRPEGEWRWDDPIPGEILEFKVDTVIAAIGQYADIDMLKEQGLEVTPRRTLKADFHTFETPMEGVFGGGDCVLSPKTAIEAVGTGKRAADTIHKYLCPGAKTGFPSMRKLMNNYVGEFTMKEAEQQLSYVDEVADRRDFHEAEQPYTDEQAYLEMKRCICSAKTGLRRMGE